MNGMSFFNMKSMIKKGMCLLFLGCGLVHISEGQEYVAPLDHNPARDQTDRYVPPALKNTALSLPFFEDFTTYDLFPDPLKWTDHSVYINNTMGKDPISRGVATFDALNARSGPYDSVNFNALVYADSLTSRPLDLSSYTPGDSLYLSFFYQPQGNGFAPEPHDSLMLYFKNSSAVWQKVWAKEGTTVQAFRQVMIPITDAVYFHADFCFRFVNKASINLNDDIWNLDYIRLDAGRTLFDTLVDDVATTKDPSFLLKDYTSMPYRQFLANASGELAANHHFTVRNHVPAIRSVVYGYTAREEITQTPIYTSPTANPNIPAGTEQQFDFPMHNISFSPANPNDRVVLEQTYYATTVGGDAAAGNDTIVRKQIFDNYLAYDDGTAEKSYFLKQFASLPAKAAVEFHLNEPDTIGGAAIYFGRQVPMAFNKFFTIAIYQDIAVNGGTEQLVYQQEFLIPAYTDTVNQFWVYRLDQPVPMPAGKFYLVMIQPASSGSDSIYYGLDVNRVGGNYHYYNVYNYWEPSLISGALMFRPVLGSRVQSTRIPESGKKTGRSWSLYPNPAREQTELHIEDAAGISQYVITDLQGRKLMQGPVSARMSVPLASLVSGMYLVHLTDASGRSVAAPKKLVKQ